MAGLVSPDFSSKIHQLMHPQVFQQHVTLKTAMKVIGRRIVRTHYASVIDVQDISQIDNQEAEFLEIRSAVDGILSQGKFLWGPTDPQTVRNLIYVQLIPSLITKSRECRQTWHTRP